MSSLFLFCVFISLSQQTFTEFVNVALNKPAYQDSERTVTRHSPSWAVDGVTKGTWIQSIHTANGRNFTWWEVDLNQSYFIHEVRIYFRYDFKWHRNGVQVYTNTKQLQANRGHLCGTVTGKPDGSDIDDITSISCDVTARYVTIYQGTDNGKTTALDFVEAEVYACEVNTKYGSNCDKLCNDRHCSVTSSSCDVRTGHCDTGSCQPGWMGSDCSTACRQNYNYGRNCKKLCTNRHCVLPKVHCNVQTGDCGTNGCKPGWKGTDCTQACTQNYNYGRNCNKLCINRHCLSSNTPCNVQTGDCGTDGCEPGWQGKDCTHECPRSTYGFNCSLNCSDRHCDGRSTCNKTNGKCQYGCQTCWAGIDCTVLSKPVTNNLTVSLAVTTGIFILLSLVLIIVIIILVRKLRRRTSNGNFKKEKEEHQKKNLGISQELRTIPDDKHTYENTRTNNGQTEGITYKDLDQHQPGESSPYDVIKM